MTTKGFVNFVPFLNYGNLTDISFKHYGTFYKAQWRARLYKEMSVSRQNPYVAEKNKINKQSSRLKGSMRLWCFLPHCSASGGFMEVTCRCFTQHFAIHKRRLASNQARYFQKCTGDMQQTVPDTCGSEIIPLYLFCDVVNNAKKRAIADCSQLTSLVTLSLVLISPFSMKKFIQLQN